MWFDWRVAATNVDLVRQFLRAQNLEQVGRVEDAIELYEAMLAERFDAVGPYDRLIEIYSADARHADVVRVAEVAVASVHTYPEKQRWYDDMKEAARRAAGAVPKATPKKPTA
ncbi:MAG: hypothetical protein M3273_09160 [Actinomycetota bacterium]|nr:hypothetical protein [Actinomycetota bacterium]